MDNNNMGYQPDMSFNPQPQKPNNAFGIASLVCGILSLLCCCCSEYVGIGLGVVAIVLFGLERKLTATKTGLATAGLICGIIAVVISVLGLILAGILTEVIMDLLPPELQSEMSSLMSDSL